jgi:hypothetical protein
VDSSTAIAIAVGAVIIVAVVLLLALREERRAMLRARFSFEYDRTVEDVGDGNHELHKRQKRISTFEIQPLSVSERDHFISAWRLIQSEFVDQPRQALAKSDDLLTEVMRARGYPMEDFGPRSADLSVDRPSLVQQYRSGREIAVLHCQGEASTEDMRQAMIHFRALFDELLAYSAADVRRHA